MMMSISENIWKNLLQRAYNYVDSGYNEWGLWKTQMESFLHASNNELTGWSDKDIQDIIEIVWKTIFDNGEKSQSIADWAAEFSQTTAIQKEMRGSMDKLFRIIENYRKSDYFMEMLSFCARFKELSPYNALMVKTQMPAARYVLTKKQWEERYHRVPKRNARPLVILKKFGPISYVFEIGDTQSSQQMLMGFYNTEQQILEELSHPYQTTGEVQHQLYENMTRALAYYGIALDTFRVAADFGAQILKTNCRVKVRDIEANGYYVINVNDQADESTAFASICHELGHFFCRHLPPPFKSEDKWWKMRRPSWETREFEAEIVSFIICERYGIGNKSWEYLSRVLDSQTTIPQDISVERVFKAANEVERMLADDLDPKTCLLYFNDTNFKREYNRMYPHEKSEERNENP